MHPICIIISSVLFFFWLFHIENYENKIALSFEYYGDDALLLYNIHEFHYKFDDDQKMTTNFKVENFSMYNIAVTVGRC